MIKTKSKNHITLTPPPPCRARGPYPETSRRTPHSATPNSRARTVARAGADRSRLALGEHVPVAGRGRVKLVVLHHPARRADEPGEGLGADPPHGAGKPPEFKPIEGPRRRPVGLRPPVALICRTLDGPDLPGNRQGHFVLAPDLVPV